MSLYSSTAKFEKVMLDLYALDTHYRKFKQGFRYKLAVECYQYVESEAQKGSPWAMKIQAGVF